jgi:hypothetical protein
LDSTSRPSCLGRYSLVLPNSCRVGTGAMVAEAIDE